MISFGPEIVTLVPFEILCVLDTAQSQQPCPKLGYEVYEYSVRYRMWKTTTGNEGQKLPWCEIMVLAHVAHYFIQRPIFFDIQAIACLSVLFPAIAHGCAGGVGSGAPTFAMFGVVPRRSFA